MARRRRGRVAFSACEFFSESPRTLQASPQQFVHCRFGDQLSTRPRCRRAAPARGPGTGPRPATGMILTLAGIAPGMRVLDLGSGVGDVALAVANRVGPTGSVLGIDRSPSALDVARERTVRARLGNVEFVEGDLTTATIEGEFDAVVGRFVLLYIEDPSAVIRRYASTIRPGGVFVAMEFEMTAAGNAATDGAEQHGGRMDRRGVPPLRSRPDVGAASCCHVRRRWTCPAYDSRHPGISRPRDPMAHGWRRLSCAPCCR